MVVLRSFGKASVKDLWKMELETKDYFRLLEEQGITSIIERPF